MRGKLAMMVLISALVLVILLPVTGCGPREEEEAEVSPPREEEQQVPESPPPAEEEQLMQEEGVLIGQLDSVTVEITVDGVSSLYTLADDLDVSGIQGGTPVVFSYLEKETGPLLLEIAAMEQDVIILQARGVYSGQIDSHSVEIIVDGEPTAFTFDRSLTFDDVAEGAHLEFAYQDDGDGSRPFIESFALVAEAMGGDGGFFDGEGIFIGLADARSVEILVTRTFLLGPGVTAAGLREGQDVAISYTETAEGAIIDSLEAVTEPPEGELLAGVYVGSAGSNQVEIDYYRVFAIDPSMSLDQISEGSPVTFTYQVGPYRPLLVALEPR